MKRFKLLKDVLKEAYWQATDGKGHIRHDDGKTVSEQHTLDIGRRHKGFLLGQAEKKINETRRLTAEQAIHELLGAIVYIAFEIILLKETEDEY